MLSRQIRVDGVCCLVCCGLNGLARDELPEAPRRVPPPHRREPSVFIWSVLFELAVCKTLGNPRRLYLRILQRSLLRNWRCTIITATSCSSTAPPLRTACLLNRNRATTATNYLVDALQPRRDDSNQYHALRAERVRP